MLASEHRDKGYMYLSPVPGAEYVLPATDFILVRFEEVDPSDITNLTSFITVTGATSGVHSGSTKIASDGRTVIFTVSGDFSSNELVTVDMNPTVDPSAEGSVDPYSYVFMTSGPMSGSSPVSMDDLVSEGAPPTEKEETPPVDSSVMEEDGIERATVGAPMIMPNGVSVPSDFPAMDIQNLGPTADGYIFIDYSGSPGYTMILENSGAPVWYQRGSAHRDFKVQKNGILTWTNFQGYDQNFNYLRSFHAVNGYGTDDHELQVLENGHYLLFGVRGQSGDMTRFVSRPPGQEYATVNETCLQEFTPEGDLIFQWRAWDNHDIRLVQYWSYDDDPRTAGSIRFTHMNAVDVDYDGNLLVSSKRVSEVTKIDRNTGEVIWRLGSGQHPDDPNPDPYPATRLTILGDPLGEFNVQHDIRVVGENRYTVFDNHHLDSNPNSRAVEYEVDPNAMTATMVWEYSGGYDSFHMGNAQRLPNGNTLINWVIENAPKVTEVQPDGTKVYEMNWSARNSKSYRTFRFPWTGVVEKPYLIVDDQSYTDSMVLIFNKFGDPNVAYYNIYSDTSSPPTTLFDTSTDTMLRIYSGLPNGTNYFRVTAVDNLGRESTPSNVESGFVNFSIIPGENMVKNGDFADGEDEWTWEATGTAMADWLIESEVSHFDITSGGTQFSEIQLRQGRMQLTQGKEYIFEFDAWCSPTPRQIEVKVVQEDGGTDYSQIGIIQLTPNQQHFSYTFTMEDPSDFNAQVEFNLGVYTQDVYLDNISLREKLPEGLGIRILVVSDAADPLTAGGDHEDDELVAWLQSLRYTVDTHGMNQEMQGTFDVGDLEAIAACDLILVTRRTNSGSYNEPTQWNTLTKPLILCSGYLTRNSRWYWHNSDSSDTAPNTTVNMTVESGQEGHPFLNGLTGPVQLFDWSAAPTPGQWPKGVFLPEADFVGGSTLIGRFGDSDPRPMLADIPAGTTLVNGNVAGERRVFFGHWGYDTELGAPYNREANWDDFITENYKTILHNIIKEVLGLVPGDFDLDGCVELDDLAVLVSEWLQDQGELRADLDDSGRVDGKDFGIFADHYMQSCP